MSVSIDQVLEICEEVSYAIGQYEKGLSLFFIPHHDGQRYEAIRLAAQDISQYKAGDPALQLLKKTSSSEETALMGMAVAREKYLFGITHKNYYLAPCSFNIDEFDTVSDVYMQAWHCAWHGLDIVRFHQSAKNKNKDDYQAIVRERNALEVAMANLQADLFAVSMGIMGGYENAINSRSLLRCRAALSAQTYRKPEYFPFAIAHETAMEALKNVKSVNLPPLHKIENALRMTKRVFMVFQEEHIKHWLGFCDPAQDMAWRGYSDEQIISAAINTCPNDHVRSIAFLVSELSGVKPANMDDVIGMYSPYADNHFNMRIHERMVERNIKDVITQSMSDNSVAPFAELAHEQNKDLTNGKSMGWCASALHHASIAFEEALARNESGEVLKQSTLDVFVKRNSETSWDDLEKLGRRIVKTQRGGKNVTLNDLKKMVEDIESLSSLKESIERTISAPTYQKSLEAASELESTKGLQPIGPAPGAVQPKAEPVPAAPAMAAVPGMGGGKSASVQIQTAKIPADQAKSGEAKEEGDAASA